MISWQDRTLEHAKDMLKAIANIRECISSCTKEDFCNSERLSAEAVLGFIVLGESANRIDKAVQSRYPQIVWHRLVGMRNVLVHEYGKTNYETVWNTAANDLTTLELNIKEMIAAYPWPIAE